ncbi:MAG: 16S rRNA (guanine(527)-N(7))-methyltransferase RsmG [Syntrophobacteraceae bacterium]
MPRFLFKNCNRHGSGEGGLSSLPLIWGYSKTHGRLESLPHNSEATDTGVSSDFSSLTSEYAHAAGVVLSDEQVELCRIHVELMIEWNRRLNLTRITAPDEVIVKHLLDSLKPASSLPRSGPALDIGTGAGFPGIPMKIFSPDLDVVLLDASRKRVSFLAMVVAKLGLKGIRAVHARWEDFTATTANREAFQLITMRAVRLEARHLSLLAAGSLAVGGIFAWWGGPESEETASEITRVDFPGLSRGEVFSYTLPGISRPRSIHTWRSRGVSGEQ